MSAISAATAHRQFSALLRRVAQGETLTVTSRGKPVQANRVARDGSRDDLYD